jgi:protocatechuate 3,4-dioxygenase beta subunit
MFMLRFELMRPGRLAMAALAAAMLLTNGQAHAQTLAPTTATGIGVWYQPNAPAAKDLWQPNDPGERLFLKIIVRDPTGVPVAGAQAELWQANGDGVVQANRYRTRLRTAADGSVAVSTALPGYIWRARHIHVMVTHPDYPQLITRILFLGDPLLAEMAYPELAINLEQGNIDDQPALFGVAEIILSPLGLSR